MPRRRYDDLQRIHFELEHDKRNVDYELQAVRTANLTPAPIAPPREAAATSAVAPVAPTPVYSRPFEIFDVQDTAVLHSPATYRQSRNVTPGAELVWYAPNWLYWWGGGTVTFLRFAKLIADLGWPTTIFVYDNHGYPPFRKLIADMDEAFPGHKVKLTGDIKSLPKNHVAIATAYQSVFHVLKAGTAAARFYFMQEYESLFYPGGTQAEQANATYQLGFKGICGGDWLRSIFKSYGGDAIKFDFAVDREVFYPADRPIGDVKRLFFYGRPSTERRMYDLGVAALELIHNKFPKVEIIIAGLDGLAQLPFPATYLGNLSIPETGDLYRTCDVGLTFSGSNLSYLPLELMACGVPVLTNFGPQLNWFCKHMDNSYAAQPFPTALLEGFETLVASRELRQRLSQTGLADLEGRSWEKSAKGIFDYISTETGWRPA